MKKARTLCKIIEEDLGSAYLNLIMQHAGEHTKEMLDKKFRELHSK